VSDWLIDTSALIRLGASPDVAQWAARIEEGAVRICAVTRLEIGRSARSVDELRATVNGAPLAWMPVEWLTPAVEARALEVQQLVATADTPRVVRIPSLLVAAAAELAGLTVLHHATDFEVIAAVSGQPAERLRL